jgi:hypothetical protein
MDVSTGVLANLMTAIHAGMTNGGFSSFVSKRELMQHFAAKSAWLSCWGSYGSPKHATALSHMIFRIMSGFSDFHAKT